MATATGVMLLSCLRKTASKSSLRDTPEDFFIEADELAAFNFLKNYVDSHGVFPNPITFKNETGIVTRHTVEPLSYYLANARKRALYNKAVECLPVIERTLDDRNPDGLVPVYQEFINYANVINARSTGVFTLEDTFDSIIDGIVNNPFGCSITGVPTYWPLVTNATGGWQNSDLITVVGRPGIGKSYYMLLSAYAAWRAGQSVLFVSMEMGEAQVAKRFTGIHTRINPRDITKNTLTTRQRTAYIAELEAMRGGVPFHIIAGNFKKSVPSIRSLIEDKSPDVIIVDASYLLQPEKSRKNSSGRREVISDVIEELASLAKDVNRPILSSVQFNRQAVTRRIEDPSNPIAHLGLHVIGETDVIGQVSSIVIGMCEDSRNPNIRHFGFLKGREGERGAWTMHYRFDNPMQFDILTPEEIQELGLLNTDNTDNTHRPSNRHRIAGVYNEG